MGRYDIKLYYLSKKYKETGPYCRTPWHEPIIFLNENPYESNSKLFTMVRNPYDRIVSECLCKYGSVVSKKNGNKRRFKYLHK